MELYIRKIHPKCNSLKKKWKSVYLKYFFFLEKAHITSGYTDRPKCGREVTTEIRKL